MQSMALKFELAESDLPNTRRHLHALRLGRIFGWGGGVAIALVAVAIAIQTESGGKRLQRGLAYISELVRGTANAPLTGVEAERLDAQLHEMAADRERLALRVGILEYDLDGITASIKQRSVPLTIAGTLPAATETETKRLAAQVGELAADHDRLAARIATLENNLEDRTSSINQHSGQIAADHDRFTARIDTFERKLEEANGSIEQQREQLAATRERFTALEHYLEDMTGSIKQQSKLLPPVRTANTPPPIPSAPASTPVVVGATPSAFFPLPPRTPLAMPMISETAKTGSVKPQAVEAAPEPVRAHPVRIATAPARNPAAEPPQAKPEFGIDLGGAASLEELRIQWAAVKADYGPLVAGLRPVASQIQKHPAGGTYRLVAGPVPSTAAAALLCAFFSVSRRACWPASFDGEQLEGH